MNREMHGVRNARLGIALALALAATQAGAQVLELSVDPSTVTWSQGQQDLTVRVSLENQGAAFDIWSGTFYVTVTGNPANLPKIHNVKLAGPAGTAQYLTGTFLTGVSGSSYSETDIERSQWTQVPLQNDDPDADAGVQGLQPVTFFNTSEIAITFDRYGGTQGPAQSIPGNATAPFAEITLRRSGNLNVAGSWTLNLFKISGGTSASFFVPTTGGTTPMSQTFATVTAVPEPETLAAAVGVALVAFRLLRRPRSVAA